MPRNTAHILRKGAHMPRRGAHMLRNSAHMPRSNAHTPRKTARMPRRTAHIPRRTAHIERNLAPLLIKPALPAGEPGEHVYKDAWRTSSSPGSLFDPVFLYRLRRLSLTKIS